ncbi:bifunctional proline dehydrogenase/L-glutamate gamma-semialdehyde dehydrogenase PutA [Thermomonas sp.]|jgi:RHH-type proline utilization regulon transcriptional repressor/proline dehydrogenase/delta 1-pyrroline-5-carboxylate dehydrogenase|uniref:bifunctional proline dehydrogenase/L-glutamate gamma-semialdehyde dehydrogenase PutA n=2 Tax=Pseudomonadota TaxID=1224 RepID=UPI00257FBCED|nr:bifunctional proline dehydrogenase/L-glutamate gamma-semialdehyde dehydrogenase PutA [Thermomonas sp.]
MSIDSPTVSVTHILSPELAPPAPPTRAAITAGWIRDEASHVRWLLEQARLPAAERDAAQAVAADLVRRVRARAKSQGVVEAFMRQYDLGSEEGVLLMCVAEALLRIPDQATADALIRDKLGDANWKRHLGQSDSVLVNASTWGLMLTGKLVNLADDTRRDAHGAFQRLVGRAGEPVIRLAVRQAMKIMGHQFVLGRTIDEALARSRKGEGANYRYSFDMLGEGALTTSDALRYQEAYRSAIHAIGRDYAPHRQAGADAVFGAPSISVKLSALHPRYEHAKRARVLDELGGRLLELSQLAKQYDIGLTIDAEETDRLELSLDLIFQVLADDSLRGWNGFGIVVQAYQKRAPFVIDYITHMAAQLGRRIPVRLVKGAYWDAEIKRAQMDGQAGYPLFTRKQNTDVSYLANARRLLDAGNAIYPMFATHNAQTIATVHRMARAMRGRRDFEFQKLHGMGDDLYAEVIPADRLDVPCRVYAPVGSHEDLLPYLVRRLLENGANSSFVNRITDESIPVEELIRDPVEFVSSLEHIQHPRIPLPVDLYRSQNQHRGNSMGINLANDDALRDLAAAMNSAGAGSWTASPLVAGTQPAGEKIAVTNPADRRETVGHWQASTSADVERALANAVAAQPGWDATPASSRAALLEHAADLLEARMPAYMAMCTKEAGKTLADGIAEVREAVDFLRYYALQAREHFAPIALPGPTGEFNQLQLAGRGVFACISPWNFPLAIFLGQIAAALAAGNTVIAKPAEQTNLIGFAAVKLMHEAGIPQDVLQYLPGDGATVGAALTRDPRVAGVCFTGSTETARLINRALASREAGPIATLIAETGGQNAMIADSSSLPEQVVKDALGSAFTSAGQRCSAARVLLVQDDIADKVIGMLAGAMAELKVGDPGLPSTDVGPVIDTEAKCVLDEHAAKMQGSAKFIARATLGEGTQHGTFFAPTAWELQSIAELDREKFGPALHVVRWKADELDALIDTINATGYGLTLGIHSRIDATIDRIVARAKVGNIYVNRNQIGAVVGVQPFGGQGLSGTGPKAGGPHYLPRFATEKTVTVNTTAAGGNASLLTLGD